MANEYSTSSTLPPYSPSIVPCRDDQQKTSNSRKQKSSDTREKVRRPMTTARGQARRKPASRKEVDNCRRECEPVEAASSVPQTLTRFMLCGERRDVSVGMKLMGSGAVKSFAKSCVSIHTLYRVIPKSNQFYSHIIPMVSHISHNDKPVPRRLNASLNPQTRTSSPTLNSPMPKTEASPTAPQSPQHASCAHVSPYDPAD